MVNKKNVISLAIYLYVALPFLIFAAGFLKFYFALPIAAAIVASVFFAAKNSYSDYSCLNINTRDKVVFALGFLLIVALVIASGIGNVAWQNKDHATRNALFNVLVNSQWPPTGINSAGDAVGMVYYIGFWLPAALFGKIFGLGAGYVFQIIWAAAGIFLLWYLLCLVHKKVVIYPLIIFLFFSGLDSIGHFIITNTAESLSSLQKGMWAYSAGSAFTSHLEWWAGKYQYSSHITQLFWVFNQCLPVWLTTVMLLLEKNNKNMVFLMGLALLSSTLPFIGLIPIFVWCVVTGKNSQSVLERSLTDNPKGEFFSLFSFQNIAGGGLSGIISFLYLKSNIASTATSASGTASATAKTPEPFSIIVFLLVIVVWAIGFALLSDFNNLRITSVLYFIPAVVLGFLLAKTTTYTPALYFLFITFEVLILVLPLLPAYRKSSLLFLCVSCLLIIPFFKVGRSIDFCMRASIPLLVVLCLFISGAVAKYISSKNYALLSVICLLIFIGSITPMHEIARTVEASHAQIASKGKIENPSIKDSSIFNGKNFTGKLENNLFFDVFAKSPDNLN